MSSPARAGRHTASRLAVAVLLGSLAGAGVLAVAAGPAAASHSPHSVSDDFRLEPVFTGLDFPTVVRFGGDGRAFVATKDGTVLAYDSVDDSTPTEVVSVTAAANSYWDRGLLGIEVDPGFPAEPYVYLFYTLEPDPPWNDDCPDLDTDGCPANARISRVPVGPDNRPTGREQVLLEGHWCQQYPSHTNDALLFGPDGALYASAGEGANFSHPDWGQFGGSPGSPTPVNPCGDPWREGGALRAQDLRTGGDPIGYTGAIIRIDPDTGAPLPDNPGAGSDAERRVVAYGLRNPFRLAFSPAGELWIGDVGWRDFEELNRHPDTTATVVNYGWPCYEGPDPLPAFDDEDLPLCETLYANGSSALPYWSYRRGDPPDPATCASTDSALSGLAFSTSTGYASRYRGALFLGDYSAACIWAMKPGADGLPDPNRISTIVADVPVVDIVPGPGGALFVVTADWGVPDTIYRLTGSSAPVAVIVASQTYGPAPVAVDFDASGSVAPAGDPLSFAWDLDGDGAFDDATGPTASAVYTATKTTVSLRATASSGAYDIASITVYGHDRPKIDALAPPDDLRWRVGDTIPFSGAASDLEDGALPPAAFSWSLLVHHCGKPDDCHAHQVSEAGGIAAGAFVAPDHPWPSTLEIRLTVTDSGGLSASRGVVLQPRTATLRIDSDPPGARVALGPEVTTAPVERTVIVGSEQSVAVPAVQTLNRAAHGFVAWSDGGARRHVVTVPEGGLELAVLLSPDAVARPSVGMVDPVTGLWHLREAGGGVRSFYFGNPGDVPFTGDWDCDGVDTPGLYRPEDGFVYLANRNASTTADVEFFFGDPGDVPVAGDFDGDGCDTVSLYRPEESRFYVIDRLGNRRAGLGRADRAFTFGNPGDAPFSGDLDGDGDDEVGLYRGETGFVYFRHSLTSGSADAEFYFGNPADRVVSGDWDGDGRDTVGIFRPEDATFYLSHTNAAGPADEEIPFGEPGMHPIAGRFG